MCANLASILHRALEAADTQAGLRRVFADPAVFAVHPPLPHGLHFGDEGAANHMRLAASHGQPGVNVFVHGARRDGRFPERQALRASQAVARLAGAAAPVFALQSARAIEAGAFHNDVVAVANERMLLAHKDAFDDVGRRHPAPALGARAGVPVSGGRRFRSRHCGAVLSVQFPDRHPAGWRHDPGGPGRGAGRPEGLGGGRTDPGRRQSLDQLLVADLRESMRNGGGPACLRLRVPLSPAALAAVDARRFLLDEARIEALSRLVEQAWPKSIAPSDLADPALWRSARAAHAALERTLRDWA